MRTKRSTVFAIQPDESQAEYDQSLENYRRDFAPANEEEELLVLQMVQSKWKLARINRMEAALVAQMMADDPEHNTAEAVLAAAMLSGKAKPYHELQRQAAAAERAYFQALRKLRRARKDKATLRLDSITGNFFRA